MLQRAPARPRDAPAEQGEDSAPHKNANLILSFPKSGRTWLRYVLHLAGIEARYSHSNTGTGKKELGSPRIEIDPIIDRSERIVFLQRNPIDTAISFYFEVHYRGLSLRRKDVASVYLRLLKRGELPPKGVFDFLCHPAYGVLKVCRFNEIMRRHLRKANRNFVEISYEDLRQNPTRGFARILDFLSAGRTFDVERLVRDSAFEKMKAVEAPWTGPAAKKVIPGLRPGWYLSTNARKVRRGKVGGYRDYLNREQCLILEGVVRDFGSDPTPYLADPRP